MKNSEYLYGNALAGAIQHDMGLNFMKMGKFAEAYDKF